MAGKPQQPPRIDGLDPAVADLLLHRYRLHIRHPVPAEEIARAALPDGTRTAQRNLAAKVTRLFRDGIGKSSVCWEYFRLQIVLAFPEEEWPAELEECARLYRRAFPHRTDAPSPALPDDMVSVSRGAVKRLLHEEQRQLAEEMALVLDENSMFNPCRRLRAFALTTMAAGEDHTAEISGALADCERQIAAVRSIGDRGSDRAGRNFDQLVAEHEGVHRDVFGDLTGRMERSYHVGVGPPAEAGGTAEPGASPDGECDNLAAETAAIASVGRPARAEPSEPSEPVEPVAPLGRTPCRG